MVFSSKKGRKEREGGGEKKENRRKSKFERKRKINSVSGFRRLISGWKKSHNSINVCGIQAK
jgi:hypothetical protein